jgi:hypothetical protein
MPIRGDWKWYITIAAVRQWMTLTGRGGELEEDNPEFIAAQNELGDLSLTARLAVDASEKQKNGGSIYRGKVTVKGKRVRAECTVMPPLRSEGPLPQLVRVTIK